MQKKKASPGEKIIMSQEIIETTCVLGLQNYVNCERMNPIEITLNSNNIIENYWIIKGLNTDS